MNTEITRQIGDIVRRHESFLVAGHIRPDGDVLGCQIALGLTLLALGKRVEVWNPDGMSRKYSFLPRAELMRKPPEQPQAFDVVFAIDTAAYDRMGSICDRIASRRLLVNLDHHTSNGKFGDVVWVEPAASATGELVYDLLRANQWPITPDIAANLYVAISTDTGSFQYPSTTPRTLRIAAELIEAGADASELARHCYESFPLARTRLLQLMLAGLRMSADNRIGSAWLTAPMYQQSGARHEDSEGLIDHIREIACVVVALVFEEEPDGIVRVSLRSKSPQVSVDRIASRFGGGGHHAAAGARIKGEPAAVEAMVLRAVEEALPAQK